MKKFKAIAIETIIARISKEELLAKSDQEAAASLESTLHARVLAEVAAFEHGQKFESLIDPADLSERFQILSKLAATALATRQLNFRRG